MYLFIFPFGCVIFNLLLGAKNVTKEL
jgi:hypothetical protein